MMAKPDENETVWRDGGLRRRQWLAAGAAWACAASTGRAVADSFPSRPLRLVVPLAPGGATDIVGRLLAEHAGRRLGQPIVVDNRPGAGGIIGSAGIAQGPADGYHLLFGTIGTLAVSPSMTAQMPYDADRAFSPVTLATGSHFAVVAHPGLGVQSLQALIARAKEKPGALSYGSAGNGSMLHLGMELLKSLTGIDIVHVPYKSSAQVMVALMSGEVHLGMPDLPSALPQAKAERVRVLAVTGPQRSASLPQVPTMAESGVAGFELVSWLGVLAPAATPRPIVERLNQAMVEALRSDEAQRALVALDAWTYASSPEEFDKFLRAERTKWGAIVQRAGVRMG
jgi:tripartite-type tricarboxylate transporter receptor subunit TctC